MDINTIRGLITLVVMLTFIGVWAWAWSSKRKHDFEEAANLPFRADPEGNGQEGNEEGDRK
ncbi:MAG: cbb3-type cytochrome c oxidase subunit 3 [Gammaproteobacteria bacterium]|nr:cbb3-type cytochrome c oxidase subunit 3 [Gammaproteobacteria bacterium]